MRFAFASDCLFWGDFGAFLRANFGLGSAFDRFARPLPGFYDAWPAISLGVKPILAIIADTFLISAARRLLSFSA